MAPVRFQNYEILFSQLIKAIKENNIAYIKALLKKFNIRNVASLKNLEANSETANIVRVRGNGFD